VTIERIDVGHTVVCDDCSKDFTASDEVGGLLFQSKAIGPCCAPVWEANARQYHEERFIRARCPVTTPFRIWVLGLRGGDNTVKILTGADAQRWLDERRKAR
jgi:hypothetical protein